MWLRAEAFLLERERSKNDALARVWRFGVQAPSPALPSVLCLHGDIAGVFSSPPPLRRGVFMIPSLSDMVLPNRISDRKEHDLCFVNCRGLCLGWDVLT